MPMKGAGGPKAPMRMGASCTPVLIVGMGRSGTQLLSWAFEVDPVFHNSYENRYVWAYGRLLPADDMRSADDADPSVGDFIRGFFASRARATGRVVVDKTPSNVFRLPLIHAVFPEAKILHIIRDGRDNVLSRYHEWFGGRMASAARAEGARGDAGYRRAFLASRWQHFLEMLQRRNVPFSCWPAFLFDNAWPFFVNITTGRPIRYGERFPGMAAHLRTHGLLATAGAQWREGVMQAMIAGRGLPPGIYLELRYEDLVARPEATWRRVAAFLGMPAEGPSLDYLCANVRPTNIDKWRREATPDQLRTLEPFIRPTLEFLGYEWVDPDDLERERTVALCGQVRSKVRRCKVTPADNVEPLVEASPEHMQPKPPSP